MNAVLENLSKTTESAIQFQQEMFKKWINTWPSMPSQTPWAEQTQAFQKKCTETYGEMLKKQREILEGQFKAGLQVIEGAFQVAAAKDPEELCAKMAEHWQQCVASLQQLAEAQLREFQSALTKWSEVMATKP